MTNKKEKMKKKTQKEREFDKWWEEWELTTGHSPTKIATYSWHIQKIRQREAEVWEKTLKEVWMKVRNSKPKFYGKNIDDKTEQLIQDIVYETKYEILDDIRFLMNHPR